MVPVHCEKYPRLGQPSPLSWFGITFLILLFKWPVKTPLSSLFVVNFWKKLLNDQYDIIGSLEWYQGLFGFISTVIYLQVSIFTKFGNVLSPISRVCASLVKSS